VSLKLISNLLSGSWITSQGTVVEVWLAQAGNMMLGMNRDTSRPGNAFFEYMRIEIREGKIFYVAQPLGKPPSYFEMVKLGGRTVVFQNLAHDFPQIITYKRVASDRLCASIGDEKEPEKIDWCWKSVGNQ
jgi:hypothetical protein